MGQALYRKYRSKNLSEIVGQAHITGTLENALKSGAISHAYLLTGPRGTGKTSVARILAHEVNQLPYQEDATHLDIIEIDAASNRRIDEIRELRERVHTAPASSKYKVYIIDEVHMLTKEAFNALLKTLEEPPAHAIFILATTEPHKLPETIISRTQRFTFKPIDREEVKNHLGFIAKQEKTKIDDEALELIAEHGGGSFRDSISLLDQIRNVADEITVDHVRQSLGIAPETAISNLLTSLESGQMASVIELLTDLREQGYQAPQLAKQLGQVLRRQLLDGSLALPQAIATKLLERLIDVPASHDPEVLLELLLVESMPENKEVKTTAKSPEPAAEPIAPAKKAAETKPTAEPKPKPSTKKTEPEPQPKTKPAAASQPASTGLKLDEKVWQEALAALKKKHNTLYSVARMANPSFSDNQVTLAFGFAFHQKRLNDAKNKQIVSAILSEMTGAAVSIDCILDENQQAPAPAATPKTDPLNAISNIFGSAEVLE